MRKASKFFSYDTKSPFLSPEVSYDYDQNIDKNNDFVY
jgi:hypothetical protein